MSGLVSSSREVAVLVVAAEPAAKKAQNSPAISLIAGGSAGAVEAAATYPFEYAKTRIQLERKARGVSVNPFTVLIQAVRDNGFRSIYTGCSTLILGTTFKASGRIDDANSAVRRYRGGIHATGMIIREAGVSELYRGLLSTTLKQSATSAVRMGSYNVLKDLCAENNVPRNSVVTFATGAVAGVITVYATQPFDTMKTKSQSARGASTMEACRMVFAESGIRGFWRGSSMRLARLVFSGGIVFTIYEKVTALLTR
ncbi:hypothetical protein TrVGV298_002464 [Trichoderma virens]|nr:hypothetical protein TrVGV298_002464 [Trichoderma virens]